MESHLKGLPGFAGTVLISMLLASPVAAETKLFSYDIDQSFTTTITDAAIKKTPAWRSGEDNPPLSARRALSLAEREKSQLVTDTKDWTWEFSTATLVPTKNDRWYWVIKYQAHGPPGSGGTGLKPYLDVAVLMDGTVVETTVTPKAKRQKRK